MHAQVRGIDRQGLLQAQVALRPVAAREALELLKSIFETTPRLTVVHLWCDYEWEQSRGPVPARKRQISFDSRFVADVLQDDVITTAFDAPVPLVRCRSIHDVAVDFNTSAEASSLARHLAEVLDIGHAHVEAKLSIHALSSLDMEHLEDLFRFS